MDITLRLPEESAKRAEEAGLLTDEKLAALIEAELKRRQRVDALFDDMESLQALEPPMTPVETDAGIQDCK